MGAQVTSAGAGVSAAVAPSSLRAIQWANRVAALVERELVKLTPYRVAFETSRVRGGGGGGGVRQTLGRQAT